MNCNEITIEGLVHFEGMKKLEQLDISYVAPQISAMGIARHFVVAARVGWGAGRRAFLK
jgi:hypothetical protein